jgi:hypothetical protein
VHSSEQHAEIRFPKIFSGSNSFWQWWQVTFVVVMILQAHSWLSMSSEKR